MIAEVIAALGEQPLLAIVGPSGAGKSSFMRAGVIPALSHTCGAWDNDAAFSPDGKRIAAASDDHTVSVWTDLEPLQGVEDLRLWTATTYCPPIERRIQILGVPEVTARADQQACLRRVEQARAVVVPAKE